MLVSSRSLFPQRFSYHYHHRPLPT
jgi:hypothetical protein